VRSVIVTGGCGFIGSHFIRKLIERTDLRVVNLDKLTYAGDPLRLGGIEEGERYRMVKGDIVDEGLVDQLFQEEQPWAVVNFAAESHVDRSILDASPFLQANVLGVQTLLEAARRASVERFVQISTDEVYGDADGKLPFDEDSPLTPSSPYAATKAAADLLCLAYRRTHQVPVLIVRSSNNYGPFQFPEKFIPLMIRNALRVEEVPIYGDGSQRRDWLYVEDNAHAILRALETGAVGSIYNLGAGEEVTNLQVARCVCRTLAEEAGKEPEIVLKLIRSVADRPGHDRRYAMSVAKAARELKWTPTVSFEQGLKKTVRWYLENRDWTERVVSKDYSAYYDAVYRNAWKKPGA